ncbi:MAG TPA: lysylphosphatidylglycerol synthase domain-containing protein [Opitutaceae bacterium]|nr:lysylphosphatidylglycerol synthase domain-containing protein [Opitutaceae bacterium]
MIRSRRSIHPGRRRWPAFAALAGMALGTAVVIWLGAGQIWHALLRIGWAGLGYVLLWQLAVFAPQAAGWWALCPGAAAGPMYWARLVREGGLTCLPLSAVGGLFFGTRAVMLGGVGWARAAASGVVDTVTEGVSLVPFIVFGLAVLGQRRVGAPQAELIGGGLAVLLATGGAVWLCRRRLAALGERALTGLLRRWKEDAAARAKELRGELAGLFARPGRFWGATALHGLGWAAGAGNVWIGYHLLGARPTVLESLALEGLFSGALSVGLLVPGAFGVQELSYVGIGRLFGLPAPLSLALSLVRRARDILLGGPALLSWQAIEAARLRRRA